MTKNDLIKLLDEFDDDACITIGDTTTGWSNLDHVKIDGCSIAFMIDSDGDQIFSSDK